VGDFNLIRHPENTNKPGGDNNLVMAFNEAISKLGVIEIPLSGQEFTWSNKQHQSLLERLDWFIISQAWSVQYSGTGARTLTRDTSDHVPCAITIKTEVPKVRIFRFEKF
jgi:endonuclease/exonuclease/phosphatase family metal-dependent hydrolase